MLRRYAVRGASLQSLPQRLEGECVQLDLLGLWGRILLPNAGLVLAGFERVV